MPTPCRAACKNEAGICSGCHRTMEELAEWRQMDEDKRASKMEQLTGTLSTHCCPNCGESAFCDISAGKDTCWCFELEKRDASSLDKTAGCLCRKCLAALPVE
ncbi:cysteine-rich CWC family protein [Vibrio hangzhouensis]|uniref:cysteine-rich CWC family protein n=1 Tax=Vibrio hangzhouensis TaxID=462991 RepID=UPI001C981E39|nr:cysteine-rich CWC family protein [Vibrio hangzhouensis]MBY6196093.1 cysteine-rich CWC family protein [Vibrio hangzhouensis]